MRVAVPLLLAALSSLFFLAISSIFSTAVKSQGHHWCFNSSLHGIFQFLSFFRRAIWLLPSWWITPGDRCHGRGPEKVVEVCLSFRTLRTRCWSLSFFAKPCSGQLRRPRSMGQSLKRTNAICIKQLRRVGKASLITEAQNKAMVIFGNFLTL